MADRDPREACIECRDEFDRGYRTEDEVKDGVFICVYCLEPSCESHGEATSIGFAHTTCDSLPDYTRADDGRY